MTAQNSGPEEYYELWTINQGKPYMYCKYDNLMDAVDQYWKFERKAAIRFPDGSLYYPMCLEDLEDY